MSVQTRQPQFFPKQSGNKIPKNAQAGDFQQINAGAVKTIYAKIVPNRKGVLEFDASRVLYMSNSVLGRMELDDEVEKAEEIGRVLRKKLGTKESYIQTDLVRKGNGSVEAPKAVGDLDGYVKKSELTLNDRIDIAYQLVQGMHNMQKAGYVTGDAKLENILVFHEEGRRIIRLSDFGKARELGADETSYVNGNPRFTAPEGTLSYKGEVFSTALMMLRVLEESLDPVLCQNLTVAIQKGTSTLERRGVEGLLLRNGRKNKKGITGQLAYLGAYAVDSLTPFLSLKQGKKEEALLHRHIDALSKNYFNTTYSGTSKDRVVLTLLVLLKEMTQADPEKRPSMKEVAYRFKKSMEQDTSSVKPRRTRAHTIATSKSEPKLERGRTYAQMDPRASYIKPGRARSYSQV